MLAIFGWISGLLSALCYLPYLRDIVKGKTKPERASWLIWTVLGGIAFFSQLAKGATDSLWMTSVQSLGVAIIFLLALKYGTGGLGRKDYLALSFAAVGIVLWYVTKEAAIALYIIIAIDAVGALLTIHKAYLDPGSETFSTWFLAGISGLFACLAVGEWSFVLLSYPVYICLINLAVTVAMRIGEKKQ